MTFNLWEAAGQLTNKQSRSYLSRLDRLDFFHECNIKDNAACLIYIANILVSDWNKKIRKWTAPHLNNPGNVNSHTSGLQRAACVVLQIKKPFSVSPDKKTKVSVSYVTVCFTNYCISEVNKRAHCHVRHDHTSAYNLKLPSAAQ